MFILSRVSVMARRQLLRQATSRGYLASSTRLFSANASSSGVAAAEGARQSDEPSTMLYAATGLAIAAALGTYVTTSGPKVVAKDEEEKEEAPVPSTSSNSSSSSSSNGSDSSGAGTVTAGNDEEINYDTMDMTTDKNGNIVLTWERDGTHFSRTYDKQSGNALSTNVDKSETAASDKETSASASSSPQAQAASSAESDDGKQSETSTPAASEPEQSQPPSTQDLVSELNQRLARIERHLGISHHIYDPIFDYPHFAENNKSLLKKHLSKEVFAACCNRVTSNGFTFADAIQSGVDNQDSGVGVYAGDEDCYSVFSPLFDAVIEDYHNGYKPTDRHVSNMDASQLRGKMDPQGDYVISTRIRVGRNIRGLGLSPGCSRAQRREVEAIVTTALNAMEGDLAGKYYSLSNMTEQERQQLVDDHFLFKKGDRFLQSAGANRDWPESRGIFHNDNKSFLVWVNEEDQMRIISMQKGSDAKEVFERLARGIAAIETQVRTAGYEFAYNDHLGYIHSCPTNCGTGMRASVHVKLPNVSKHPNFKSWCDKLRLQPRGIHGEHSESEGGIYDISNKERLGKSEVELVQTMIDGVSVLIDAEKALAAGKPVPEVLTS